MAHIVLLFFISGKNADLLNISIQKAVKHRASERACAACYQKCLSRKVHISNLAVKFIQVYKKPQKSFNNVILLFIVANVNFTLLLFLSSFVETA
jgi:hypothetical protein